VILHLLHHLFPALGSHSLALQSFEEQKLELERLIKTKEAKLEELKRRKLLAEQKFSNEASQSYSLSLSLSLSLYVT
jgi:fatty acid desaturase